MSETPTTRPSETGCPFPWCTTAHGDGLHPDDEVHRSAGVAVAVLAARDGRVFPTEVEVGLTRHDGLTWLVIEDGGDVRLALSIESARRLRATIDADPALRDALERG